MGHWDLSRRGIKNGNKLQLGPITLLAIQSDGKANSASQMRN